MLPRTFPKNLLENLKMRIATVFYTPFSARFLITHFNFRQLNILELLLNILDVMWIVGVMLIAHFDVTRQVVWLQFLLFIFFHFPSIWLCRCSTQPIIIYVFVAGAC